MPVISVKFVQVKQEKKLKETILCGSNRTSGGQQPFSVCIT